MFRFAAASLAGLVLIASPSSAQRAGAPTAELDTFMQQVLERRDDNWKKVQQYILDEFERAEFRGPGDALMWGEKREYLWYPRDGVFVRSPVRFNGATIGERDREKYEQDFLKQAREREERGRDPQFISSAYFLRFKFEGERYALVGRETLDGREVLRIEYYPTRLFSEEPATRAEARGNQAAGRKSKDDAYGDEVQRLMNKASLVTLWIEPNLKQIVRYTFDNVGFDFLPAAWLVRVTDLKASMLMTEAFPSVWLPSRIEMAGAIALAPGPFTISYDIQYSGYREAVTSTKYRGVPPR
jgi:hypothetical protein